MFFVYLEIWPDILQISTTLIHAVADESGNSQITIFQMLHIYKTCNIPANKPLTLSMLSEKDIM